MDARNVKMLREATIQKKIELQKYNTKYILKTNQRQEKNREKSTLVKRRRETKETERKMEESETPVKKKENETLYKRK